MKARVFVTLKPSVFDPQGQTIADALHSMGYGGVGDVRQGKYFELEVGATTPDQARSLASEVADKLLANPVIESYRVEIEGGCEGHEIRRCRLPRIELRSRHRLCRPARARPGGRVHLAQGHEPEGRRRRRAARRLL